MTGMPSRGVIQLVCFCAVFAILFVAYRRFPALNNFLGIVLLVVWVVLGIVAVIRAQRSSGMPTFHGALPPRWRKWFTGD
ncbi:MAG TPA: hypothetical protein VKB72_16135 [Steroidobacteraceae bacterium]|nr:hypothetical protein [Steroidobacteraceae bacterium]